MPMNESLTERAYRTAETMGVDIEDVRAVETDVDGATVRVLLVDAEDEVDQVGFDVTRPPGQHGEEFFDQQLRDGLRKLKRRTLDRESSSQAGEQAGDSEPARDTSTTQATTPTHQARSGATHTAGVSLDVTMDDTALEGLRSEMQDVFDEFESQTVSAERFDELESRLTDIDERLSTLEERLSSLATVGE